MLAAIMGIRKILLYLFTKYIKVHDYTNQDFTHNNWYIMVKNKKILHPLS